MNDSKYDEDFEYLYSLIEGVEFLEKNFQK